MRLKRVKAIRRITLNEDIKVLIRRGGLTLKNKIVVTLRKIIVINTVFAKTLKIILKFYICYNI